MMMLMLFASTGFANCADEDKLYVEPSSIYIAPNGIFLNIDSELYGITSLEVDEKGIFIPTPMLGFCGKHGHYAGHATTCPYCLAEKNKKKNKK